MYAHLLLGMLAPLLLVLAAPVTLALRALPAGRARRIARLLRWPPVRLLTFPVVAAVLDVGGLWLLYTTGLYGAMHSYETVRLAVDAHVLGAGYLFAAALIGPDPAPHRASRPLRAAVLVLALAAHEVLARHVYASPPEGVAAADGQAAAVVMYYGGDAVELALVVVFCRQWYVAAGRTLPAATVTAARPRPAGR